MTRQENRGSPETDQMKHPGEHKGGAGEFDGGKRGELGHRLEKDEDREQGYTYRQADHRGEDEQTAERSRESDFRRHCCKPADQRRENDRENRPPFRTRKAVSWL